MKMLSSIRCQKHIHLYKYCCLGICLLNYIKKKYISKCSFRTFCHFMICINPLRSIGGAAMTLFSCYTGQILGAPPPCFSSWLYDESDSSLPFSVVLMNFYRVWSFFPENITKSCTIASNLYRNEWSRAFVISEQWEMASTSAACRPSDPKWKK
jgi:hypothetical protein